MPTTDAQIEYMERENDTIERQQPTLINGMTEAELMEFEKWHEERNYAA